MAINTHHWQASAQPVQLAPAHVKGTLHSAVRIGFLAGLLAFGQICLASPGNISPDDNLTPQQVVRIVVDALRDNDPENNAGIATVFRFASLANKRNTGPLSHFTMMISKGFPDMLNHSSSRYDTMEISGDIAVQAVWLMTPGGAEAGYAFQLSRQVGNEHAGMWMTDMVVPLGEGSGSGTRI